MFLFSRIEGSQILSETVMSGFQIIERTDSFVPQCFVVLSVLIYNPI